LDLFSGIGGFAIAARWAGFRTVGFCEWEPYCQKLLKQHWPGVPVHGDIRDLDGTKYKGTTIITGGFPCQPFSHAGKQRGKEDNRYLWPEMLRVIREAGPRWVLGENVAGIVNMALDQVLVDLEAQGYTTGSVIVPACAVDAPQRRDRCWILANSTSIRPSGQGKSVEPLNPEKIKERKTVEPLNGCLSDFWAVEPNVGRVAHGIPSRVDRLKGLGNAIVPKVAYTIMEAMRQME
jgi:DNA (cytosine-5)-methyltransferase 1